jgi:ABC-2 type transport system ATP-binding protein
MLRNGRVVFAGELDAVKQSHHRLTLRFDDERQEPPALNGVLSWEGGGREWIAVARGKLDDLTMAASAAGAEVVGQQWLSLDEIFLAQVNEERVPFPVENIPG